MKNQTYQNKARQGLDLLKEAVYEAIKNLGSTGYSEIARNIPALRFDIEKSSHKGWFVSEIVQSLKREGKVEKDGRKWRVKEKNTGKNSHQVKAQEGLETLKEAVYESIKILGIAGYSDIARNIPALRFDIEKPTHKGWFISELVQCLNKDGRVKRDGRKWRVKNADNSCQIKGQQGIEMLKESVCEVIKILAAANYPDIARKIPALRFDIEKSSHKSWFIKNIVTLLQKDGRVAKAGQKWRAR